MQPQLSMRTLHAPTGPLCIAHLRRDANPRSTGRFRHRLVLAYAWRPSLRSAVCAVPAARLSARSVRVHASNKEGEELQEEEQEETGRGRNPNADMYGVDCTFSPSRTLSSRSPYTSRLHCRLTTAIHHRAMCDACSALRLLEASADLASVGLRGVCCLRRVSWAERHLSGGGLQLSSTAAPALSCCFRSWRSSSSCWPSWTSPAYCSSRVATRSA
jgi:hypothetical protein